MNRTAIIHALIGGAVIATAASLAGPLFAGTVLREAEFDAATGPPEISVTAPRSGHVTVRYLNPDSGPGGMLHCDLFGEDGTHLFSAEVFNALGTGGVCLGASDYAVGVSERVFKFPVSGGARVVLGGYNPSPRGPTGRDRLVIAYSPTPILRPVTAPDLHISSGPLEENSVSAELSVPAEAFALLNATALGSGGGGFGVSQDGSSIGCLQLHLGRVGSPFLMAVSSGTHLIRITHEDPYFPDNSGTRSADLYLVSVPPDTCGNGTVDTGEECDDGNTDDTDGCTLACTVCGNGVTAGYEECDDGNLLDGDCCSSTCQRPTAILAGPIVNPANNHRYYLLEFAPWSTAESAAVCLGGHLVTVNNESEENWIWSQFSNFGNVDRHLWIGLSDAASEGRFVWVSGEASPYTHWSPGEPNDCGDGEDYVHISPDSGLWNDILESGYGGCGGDFRPNGVVEVTDCGNGALDAGEECDDGNTNASDGCTNACSVCGNGIRALIEACDDGNLVSGDGCDANCTLSACGNGIRSPAEPCDDGNTNPCDGCSPTCQIEPVGYRCGDGVLSTDCGEACDDGNTSDADACRANCTLNVCGDGVRNPAAEACDDGNTTSGDGCDANCTPTACGNGIKTAGEQCDDGNIDPCDGCTATCQRGESCGDGHLDPLCGEQCDDGNRYPFDGCTGACTICGNGVATAPEECDDGNANPNDGCTTGCTICGNEVVTPPEGCDDGNLVHGDGCDADCLGPGCGNNRIDGDEECDDGGICIGGANAGTFCTAHRQCPDGECTTFGGDDCAVNCTTERSVPVTLKPGVEHDRNLQAGTSGALVESEVIQRIPMPFSGAHMILRVGGSRPSSGDPAIPLAVRPGDLSIAPIPVGSYACLCIHGMEDPELGEGLAGAGSVTCSGTRSGVNLTTTVDHHTNDTDPQCTEGTVERAGRCEYAACVDGSYPGRACRADADCGGAHEGVCNGPEEMTAAGSGPAGSARLDLRLLTRQFYNCETETDSKICVESANSGAWCDGDGTCPGGHCVSAKGGDGVPCTSDDPVPGGQLFYYFVGFLPLDFRVALTTASATTEIADVDDIYSGRLTSTVTGRPLSCAALDQDSVVGTLVGNTPWLDLPGLHDTITTIVLAANQCGNGALDPGEVCDDGGESATCDDDCTLAACGDGTVNRTAGEECDDANSDDHDACRNDCKANVCGDGIIRTGSEQCDDGNQTDGDGCDSNCTPTACGNGVVTAGEQCDDGNTTWEDGCSGACGNEFCGDGVRQAGLNEQCDDGNAFSGDGCDVNCTWTQCGNGILTTGEECDDGNSDSEDGCSAACRNEFCGDGVRQAGLGEACDDGNSVNGDGCDVNCTMSFCGNGVVGPPEECDDGNVSGNDCCSATCRAVAAGTTCADWDVCDGPGTCNAQGECIPETGTPLDCDDGNPETLDYCDPVDGCHHLRPGLCVGDCNGGRTVTVDELVIMVNIALGLASVESCGDGDADGDGAITIDEIVAAVRDALEGCAYPATPTPRPWPTATNTPPAPTVTPQVGSR
ncbi:DUF4215 domain-containing protein [Candidatus Binatia bacterium]|nr:DUF4215 domain-containing protein [Candidatus Binatia bacterium]